MSAYVGVKKGKKLEVLNEMYVSHQTAVYTSMKGHKCKYTRNVYIEMSKDFDKYLNTSR